MHDGIVLNRHEWDESPRCECGVFGVFAPGEDVSRLAYFGIFALQHRGQESAGIAVSDGHSFNIHRDMGLVSQVFDEETLGGMSGNVAVAHTRYSTTGSSLLCNSQPVIADGPGGPIALGHNGNLVNTVLLRRKMEEAGTQFSSTIDSEVMARILARHYTGQNLGEASLCMMDECQGAYSLVGMTRHELFGIRDPFGVRPLCLGRLNSKGYVIASETCALTVVGAQFIREVLPGEVVIINENGLHDGFSRNSDHPAFCIFEFVYLARPDSNIYGKSVHQVRRRMGNLLAKEHPVQADLVIPVPDTGTPAAIGFAEASRIPYGEGLIKNRYIHRTFIQPDQRMRDLGVKMKLSPLRESLAGKRIVVVEDSIVRGTTTRNIVGVLRDAGAREVHFRISSPPYSWPCYYGIDTGTRDELIASSRSVDEIGEFIGADSIGYLSLDNLIKAVDLPKKSFCRACFDGKYPIAVPKEIKMDKYALEKTG